MALDLPVYPDHLVRPGEMIAAALWGPSQIRRADR